MPSLALARFRILYTIARLKFRVAAMSFGLFGAFDMPRTSWRLPTESTGAMVMPKMELETLKELEAKELF